VYTPQAHKSAVIKVSCFHQNCDKNFHLRPIKGRKTKSQIISLTLLVLANDEESEPEQERQLGSCPIFWSSREQKIWQDHILQRETCESMKQESLCSKLFHAQGMRCLTKIIILCLGILVLYKSSLILRFPSSSRYSFTQ